MADGIQITGLADCLKCFDEAPKNLLKLSKKATQVGAKAVLKQLRSGEGMDHWKPLLKANVKLTRDGKVRGLMGLYNSDGLPDSGRRPPLWFKALWLNYGTLEGRDPNHHFKTGIRRQSTQAAKNRRNRTGLKHRNFFEKASTGWADTFVDAFEEYLTKEQQKLCER